MSEFTPENSDLSPRQLEKLDDFNNTYGALALSEDIADDITSAELRELIIEHGVDLTNTINSYNFMAGMSIALTLAEKFQHSDLRSKLTSIAILTCLANLEPKN